MFDDCFSDVDILYVPDIVANNTDAVSREFNLWLRALYNKLPRPALEHRHMPRFWKKRLNGTFYLSVGTKHIVWWLNNCYIKDNQKVFVIESHGWYHPEYPMIEL